MSRLIIYIEPDLKTQFDQALRYESIQAYNGYKSISKTQKINEWIQNYVKSLSLISQPK